MKLHVLFVTILAQVKFNYAFYGQFVLERFGLRDFVIDLSSVNISQTCNSTDKVCIWKCCPEGKIIGLFKECTASEKDIVNVTVYDQQYSPINVSLKSGFKLVPGLMKDEMFARNSLWWYKAYLIQDGRLFLKFPNLYNRWKQINTNHFCVDMKMNGSQVTPVFMVEYEIEHFRRPSPYKKWALIVSILCLIMTLTAYAIVPQLRNQNGVLLMTYFGFLLLAFITHRFLESFDTLNLRIMGILTITLFHYFFKVSSFCITNVLFYRLLLSRYLSKYEPLPWTKQLVRYGVYAVGLPLFMTITVATIEFTDMTDMPNFVTPQIQNKGNFTFHEIESIYYLYIPLMLIISFNWIVCFLKVVEFCKTSRRFKAVSTETTEDNDFNRPMDLVKLLTVLTVYAVLEWLAVIYPKGTAEATTTYILCIGPLIVCIFLAKQTVWTLLIQQIQTYKADAASNSLRLATFLQKK